MKNLIAIFFCLLAFLVFGTDLKSIDSEFDNGNFEKSLELATNLFKQQNDASSLWRVGRAYYEIANNKQNKKETIEICNTGMNFLKPYIDGSIKGEAIDRAKVIYWYDVLYARRGKAIGVKESLDIIPELFKLADKAISIYKEFGEPYHLKGMIDEAVPSFLGGDKFRMGENLNNALKYGPETITFLADAVQAFYDRNWDNAKREKEGEKRGVKGDGTPSNLTDREYAKVLLERLEKVVSQKGKLTASERKKYNEALSYKAKLK